MFKFIHAADIHLDSPLRGLENYDGAPATEIRGAARKALQNLVQLAIDEKVEFVVIAGDVYDGDWNDFNTGLFFVNEMERLNRQNIPVFLISGNHDAVNNMTKSLRMPSNVTVYAHQKPESVLLDNIKVALHGQSFAQRSVKNNLSESYPSAVSGYFNIGILHTSATGRDGHEDYAPCTVEGLKLKGYDYWALGHVHAREMLCESPYIAFSGNIQGRHIREPGAKGVNLVSVSENRVENVEFHSVDVLRWTTAEVLLDGLEDRNAILDRVREKFQQLIDAAEGRTLAVRVNLTGATELHHDLNAERRKLVADVQATSMGVTHGSIWVEKVKLNTRPPRQVEAQERVSDEVISVLHQVFDNFDPTSDLAEKVIEDCLKKLPDSIVGRLELGSEDWMRGIIEEARAKLVQKLNA